MLGLDSPEDATWWTNIKDTITSTNKIKSHLMQIGTGEGKSVILGMLATVLALLGYEVCLCFITIFHLVLKIHQVSCACYSSYLSERDYNTFLDIFACFGVDKHIQYSTLAKLAESYINDQGDIRKFTNQFIEGIHIAVCGDFNLLLPGSQTFSHSKTSNNRPKVLLIDEVDTFLSRDFYGATYNPCTILHNEHVNTILEYIWKHQDCGLNTIRKLDAYTKLVAKYKDIKAVIKGAVQRMLIEVHNFNDPPFNLVKNKLGQVVIGYKESGSISTSIQHGYRTCFAYLHARDKGSVTKEVVQQHLGLTINCGQFSYAEIPKEYQCILGVTSTLETLCEFEKQVKDKTYKIKKETYTPSIYGDSRLAFKEVEDVFVMSDTANYHLQLIETITKRQEAKQPILVFFENEIQLDTFAASSYCNGLSYNTAKENTKNIDFYIQKATRINEITNLPEVTFFPRALGRGLDFACRDDRVNTHQGIHVLQAFLSEDVREEIQIKGRTARQGKPGTYCLILNQEDLTKQFSITPQQVGEQRHASKLYQFLHKTRLDQFERKSEERKGIIERSAQVWFFSSLALALIP
jgi:hypothetical protein